MADINLTQDEADALLAMPKVRLDDTEFEYPGVGTGIIIGLTSRDKRENFLLDISRGRIDLLKGKYQNRARQIVILARLDFGRKPHRNPDDQEIAGPHLHLYREGFGDKWAMPVPKDFFPDTQDPWRTLGHFMRYCNIIEPPRIRKGLLP